MRIAVTGAAGRVGTRLTQWLTARDHQVVGIDRVPPAQTPGLTPIVADLDDLDALLFATREADVVVHLAAAMSWQPKDSSLLRKVNVDGTWNVLDAALASDVRRFVFASSGEVYPESAATYTPVDEAHPLRPASIYGLTKLMGEEMVHAAARRAPIETVIIRLPHTQEASELLDPASGFSGPRFFLRRRIEQQRELGNLEAVAALERAGTDDPNTLLVARGSDGTPFRMPIGDARDTAQGLGLAATVPGVSGETIGVGPDEALSMDELVPMMARESGLPQVSVDLPVRAVSYSTSNAKARQLLGFEPRHPIDDMVKEAAERWHSVGAARDAGDKES